MKIFQIENTLVATARITQLENHRLLVVREKNGSRSVAVDPIGCKEGDWVIAVEIGRASCRERASTSV